MYRSRHFAEPWGISSTKGQNVSPTRPDIVVIGAMRAGTTTLHRLLDQLPGVSVAAIKETNFFCYDGPDSEQGWSWYKSQFQTDCPLWCDISPAYAKRDLYPDVAQKIATASPLARIIFIARDPVKRAISQYAHSFHSGQSLPAPSDLIGSPEGDHIISTSRYAHNLEPFLEHFGDRLEIVDFAELADTPDDFLESFMDLTGIEGDVSQVSFSASNTSEQLAQQPRWWGKLRESRWGDALRSRIPRGPAMMLKNVVTNTWGQDGGREVPAFSEDDKARLIGALEADIEAFRKISGKAFSDWCV
jgi:hypothetical protein